MRILALIPARGGSKRLPGKNVRLLGGRPLIVWSIEAAKNIQDICDIVVSTDDPLIKAISLEAGVLAPWLRPAKLATDEATSVDVALHALDWYEAEFGMVDGLLLLQPTSPFRTKETVIKGIELFDKSNRKSVVGVSQTHSHPMWTLKLENGCLVPFMAEHGFQTRSQDLPKAYVVNGSFYLTTPSNLRTYRSFIGVEAIPLFIESKRDSLDIDTDFDFKLAEFFCRLDC